MNQTAKNHYPMNPAVEPITLCVSERLAHTVFKTRGLLYALSALAARQPDEQIVSPPSDDEAHGLIWLATDVGIELDKVCDEIGDDYAKRAQAAYREANAKLKGGAA